MSDTFHPAPEVPVAARDLAALGDNADVPDLKSYTMGDLKEFIKAQQEPQDFITKDQIRPGSYPDHSVGFLKQGPTPAIRLGRNAALTHTANAAFQEFAWDIVINSSVPAANGGLSWTAGNPNRVIVGATGWYQMNHHNLVAAAAGLNNAASEIGLYDSAGAFIRFLDYDENAPVGAGGSTPGSGSGVADVLTKGQQVGVSVFQNSGGNLAYIIAYHYNFFTVAWIGPIN